ncbi:hypothetical protein [Massilia sp. CF038]|uniref:hypothetical protein n=1 Tax=Massilia sp. CF038 TaxID=1881045 RepID=UPI00091BFCD6|nr:hypothetical protein [Massilia sp. CF038]SHG55793.1 hypothetical protein SAMN05428948_1018 [Massilia sp. CF038]
MNIAKNMEVIFVAALAIIGATSFANASSVPAAAAPLAATAIDSSAPMQVVTVSAKRLTAAEKAAAQ